MTTGRRLTAVVFTDIVGYSAIVHRDEALGARLLDRQREVVRRIVPKHGGREVETAGDSFLLEFGSALAAVKAVIAIQKELACSNGGQAEGEKVLLRASVHLGDVEHRGKEVYGDGVNTAARLLSHSPEGGMALSAPVLSMVKQRIQLPVRSIGTPELKNISSPVEIFAVDAGDLARIEAPPSDAVAALKPGRGFPRRLALIAASAFVLLAAVIGWRQFASRSAVLDKSVAVLPFTDLSPAHDQEYFADGMAEELLNALAKVKDLKVAGRTSSFSFKGKNEDLRNIGRTLGVANVLEGSVRKQGDKVRITVQLIRTEDGFHVWSESYDGDLSDIFDLQERIARAITQALQVVLQGGQQRRLVPVATDNPDAYALYLKASTVFTHRDGPRFPEAIAHLQEALRLDPKFARAHARLAAIHSVAAIYTPASLEESQAATERHAQAAIALDAALAEPRAALGEIYGAVRRPLAARNELSTAVVLDPGDAIANAWLGEVLYVAGYVRESAAWFDKALAVDPLLPIALFWRGSAYLHEGDLVRARQKLQQALDAGMLFAERSLAFIAHAEGHDDEAILHMTRGERPFLRGLPQDASRVLAEGVYGSAGARARALTMFEAYLAGNPGSTSAAVPYALLMLGEPARALAVASASPTNNDTLLFYSLWAPEGAAARKLPQFADFARKVGWTEVWDRYGPPPACRRKGPSAYVCE